MPDCEEPRDMSIDTTILRCCCIGTLERAVRENGSDLDLVLREPRGSMRVHSTACALANG